MTDFALESGHNDLIEFVTGIGKGLSGQINLQQAGRNSLLPSFLGVAETGMNLIRAGWPDDVGKIVSGASKLAGLGPGLTPAGDNFLSGMMLWTWLVLDDPKRVCNPILKATKPITTILSNAFLQSAAMGECNAAWHDFPRKLTLGDDYEIGPATERILAYGSTSRADTLAGFILLALR